MLETYLFFTYFSKKVESMESWIVFITSNLSYHCNPFRHHLILFEFPNHQHETIKFQNKLVMGTTIAVCGPTCSALSTVLVVLHTAATQKHILFRNLDSFEVSGISMILICSHHQDFDSIEFQTFLLLPTFDQAQSSHLQHIFEIPRHRYGTITSKNIFVIIKKPVVFPLFRYYCNAKENANLVPARRLAMMERV